MLEPVKLQAAVSNDRLGINQCFCLFSDSDISFISDYPSLTLSRHDVLPAKVLGAVFLALWRVSYLSSSTAKFTTWNGTICEPSSIL